MRMYARAPYKSRCVGLGRRSFKEPWIQRRGLRPGAEGYSSRGSLWWRVLWVGLQSTHSPVALVTSCSPSGLRARVSAPLFLLGLAVCIRSRLWFGAVSACCWFHPMPHAWRTSPAVAFVPEPVHCGCRWGTPAGRHGVDFHSSASRKADDNPSNPTYPLNAMPLRPPPSP